MRFVDILHGKLTRKTSNLTSNTRNYTNVRISVLLDKLAKTLVFFLAALGFSTQR